MKKIYLAAILSLLVVLLGYSQNVPQGMNYQAVARDKAGHELVNQQISLKISLYSPLSKGSYYSETHAVVTNQFGLFSLIIGEGKVESGAFANVPWSKEEIWIDVAIQTEGENDFTPIGSSKLYAVPYAFYAGTAAGVTAPVGGKKDLTAGQCPCNGGITKLTFLYLGPNGVTINVYNDPHLQANQLVATFTAVNSGAVLTINVPAGPPSGPTLKDQTFFQYSGIVGAPPVQTVPTKCGNYDDDNPASPGGTFGNISIVSQTDKSGATCTACNVSGQWYIGGNAVMDACNTLGTLSNTDLTLITNNTPRLVITKSGDINISNNLNVGADLHVAKNAFLNESGGSTTNNGPFTVANASPTHLTGTLTADWATSLNNSLTVVGNTNLNGFLNVNNMQSTNLTGILTVGKATQLNSTLSVAGNTDLYGYLHVNNVAPTVLSGTLETYQNATFDQHVIINNASLNSSSTTTGGLVVAGGTGIGQSLYVGGPTFLLSTLNVGGNTDLFGYLSVDNQRPTILTGTLEDSLSAIFHQHVTLTNGNLNSSDSSNGALVVVGGVGIGKNLNVGGSATFSGPVSFKSVVTITNQTQSTDYTNGSLVTYGGVGIAKNINVNGAAHFNSTLTADGAAQLNSTLTVLGVTTLNNPVFANAPVVINANLPGDHSSATAYPLTVKGSTQGIRIQVNGNEGGIPNHTNDFVQFTDANNTVHGSITGETQSDLNNDWQYIQTQALLSVLEAKALYDVAIADNIVAQISARITAAAEWLGIKTQDVAISAIKTEEDVNTDIGEDAATTVCAGLGVCETAPPPSMIIAGAANLVEDAIVDGMEADEEVVAATAASEEAVPLTAAAVNSTLAHAQLAQASLKLLQFNTTSAQNVAGGGVYFNSNSGDYAEWLPKANPEEKIYRGDIVGVKGGLISKSTEGAEKLMVVSTMPIVLGNAPPKEKEGNFEKVAFMGQVQVKVLGKVEAGDYILCAEGATGFGHAKHSADMTSEDYQRIVGIAWESNKTAGMSYVNTAVGLNTNDVSKLAAKQETKIKAQQDEIDGLKKQMEAVNSALAKLVPGYGASSPVAPVAVNSVPAVSPGANVTENSPGLPNSKRYLQISKDQWEQGVSMAIAKVRKVSNNPEKLRYLVKLEQDANYRDQLYAQFQEKWKTEVEKRKATDKLSGY